ncbi:DUF6401 family natural product biosynthesis protein [Amycolatopsis albispora]|uniref:Uncharacterized protein n=1 Tax=Amycolatopsis albispora TaxID=1804986 RepID=A0A344L0G5_9PSEU|nr:DUF6401 family natural product biosynthesis protein [Amycolatopsis albispora]AXB41539.1 hypothetical protein A4R43_02565 [Amycolatopsis albispora]
MGEPVPLETWVAGPVRTTIAGLKAHSWGSAVLDHHQDQVRAELAGAGAPADRATLTLYLHVLSCAVDYVGTNIPGDTLPLTRVHDTGMDWFTIRIAAVCQLAISEGLVT